MRTCLLSRSVADSRPSPILVVLRETFIFWSATLQSPDPFYYPSASTTSIQTVVCNPAPAVGGGAAPAHTRSCIFAPMFNRFSGGGRGGGRADSDSKVCEGVEKGEKEVALRFDSFTCALERCAPSHVRVCVTSDAAARLCPATAAAHVDDSGAVLKAERNGEDDHAR